MKVEVNPEKITKEMSELIRLGIEAFGSFSKKFPELYWKVYVPAKNKSGGA